MSKLSRANSKETSLSVSKTSPAQVVIAGNNAIVQYDTIIYDRLREWNPATFSFTPLRQGIYLIIANVDIVMLNMVNIARLEIMLNGAAIGISDYWFNNLAGGVQIQTVAISQINQNDILDVYYNNLAGGNQSITPVPLTTIQIHRLS